VVVPEGYVYVLGDHRSNSSDSRVFGPVPVENVVGKAWLSYWPADDVGFVPHEPYTDEEAAAASLSPAP
jgi:signal peptidase I